MTHRHLASFVIVALASVLLAPGGEPSRAQTNPDSKDAEAHVKQATQRLSEADPAKALERADKALRLAPTHAGANYAKGRALLYLFGKSRHAAQERLSPVEGTPTAEERRAREEKIGAAVESWKPRLREAAERMEESARLNPSAPEVSAPAWGELLESLRFYGGAQVPAGAEAAPPTQPAQQSGATSRPVITAKPDPDTNAKPGPAVKKKGCDGGGTVLLRVVLAADGRVKHILPLKLLPDGLTEIAIDAAREIKFNPAMKDGRPVAQFVTLRYDFTPDC